MRTPKSGPGKGIVRVLEKAASNATAGYGDVGPVGKMLIALGFKPRFTLWQRVIIFHQFPAFVTKIAWRFGWRYSAMGKTGPSHNDVSTKWGDLAEFEGGDFHLSLRRVKKRLAKERKKEPETGMSTRARRPG